MATNFCMFGPTQVSMLTGAVAWGQANPLMLAVVGLGVREASAVEAAATLGSMSSTAQAVDGFRLVYAWQRVVPPTNSHSVDALLGKLLAFASEDAVRASVRGLPHYGEFAGDFEAKIAAAAGERATDVIMEGLSAVVRSGGGIPFGPDLVAIGRVSISDDRAPILSATLPEWMGRPGGTTGLRPSGLHHMTPGAEGEEHDGEATIWEQTVHNLNVRGRRIR